MLLRSVLSVCWLIKLQLPPLQCQRQVDNPGCIPYEKVNRSCKQLNFIIRWNHCIHNQWLQRDSLDLEDLTLCYCMCISIAGLYLLDNANTPDTPSYYSKLALQRYEITSFVDVLNICKASKDQAQSARVSVRQDLCSWSAHTRNVIEARPIHNQGTSHYILWQSCTASSLHHRPSVFETQSRRKFECYLVPDLYHTFSW